MTDSHSRKPGWLKTKIPSGKNYVLLKDLVGKHKLHTICESGKCPNVSECWGAGTATFMILGDICTRSCKFCAVTTGRPMPPDKDEMVKIAESINLMKLKHCVITSVDRDDLPDYGAKFWADTISVIKEKCPAVTIEALIPDFKGDAGLLRLVANSAPNIISHNLETVERLTPEIRTFATYRRSLEVLRILSKCGVRTKSGIMVGLGETKDEVFQVMDDLIENNCRIITIGQYLQPTKQNIPVKEYISPEVFLEYKDAALAKGFIVAECAPLVRSSYNAEKHLYDY